MTPSDFPNASLFAERDQAQHLPSTADKIVGLPKLAPRHIDKARLLVDHTQEKMKRRFCGVRLRSGQKLFACFAIETLLDEEPAL